MARAINKCFKSIKEELEQTTRIINNEAPEGVSANLQELRAAAMQASQAVADINRLIGRLEFQFGD